VGPELYAFSVWALPQRDILEGPLLVNSIFRILKSSSLLRTTVLNSLSERSGRILGPPPDDCRQQFGIAINNDRRSLNDAHTVNLDMG